MPPEAIDAIKKLRMAMTTMNTISKANRREPMDTQRLLDAETEIESAIRKLEEMALLEQQRKEENAAYLVLEKGKPSPDMGVFHYGKATGERELKRMQDEHPDREWELVLFA